MTEAAEPVEIDPRTPAIVVVVGLLCFAGLGYLLYTGGVIG
ncbi:hypothetical protein [Natronorarus salvus]